MCRLELTGLEKTYGTTDTFLRKKEMKRAVQNLTVGFEHGVYGLLGENGAGKTTLMRMIVGILKPTGGQITCDGIPINQLGSTYRNLLGYLPQDFGYYKEFSAVRFLNYIAALKAIEPDIARERIDQLLETVGLSDVRNRKLKTFSGGMLRRIGIAQALLNEPEILILDEPTAGLDPRERVRFRNIISALGKNRIVILSTHIVSDVEYIADQILIMKHGQLIRSGTQAQILEPVAGCVWKCIVPVETADQLNTVYAVSNLKSYNEKYLDTFGDNQGKKIDEQVELRIVSKEKPHPNAEAVEPVLEDAYLYYYL